MPGRATIRAEHGWQNQASIPGWKPAADGDDRSQALSGLLPPARRLPRQAVLSSCQAAANLPGVWPTFLPGRHTQDAIHREACPLKPDLTIVGAGLTGLTAGIEAAERGWRVVVAEAHSQPGGRARSLAAPYRANAGPHAIYADGPWWAWLESRRLTPPIVEAPRDGNLVRAGGRLGTWPAELSEAIAALPDDAPAEESFRSWLLRYIGASAAEAIVGLIFIATYDHDPGRLSAAFARERLRRVLSGGARYVIGGWSTVVGFSPSELPASECRFARGHGYQPCRRARRSWPPASPQRASLRVTDRWPGPVPAWPRST